MDERFRLVFRGEILEGQHRAVVKRRLTDLLKLSEAQLDKLFSGNPVTIKRDATPPVITFAGNAGTYLHGEQIQITCSALDALSGIQSSTCPSVDAPATDYEAGIHTLEATAIDVAGNTVQASTSFEVIVDTTPPSMISGFPVVAGGTVLQFAAERSYQVISAGLDGNYGGTVALGSAIGGAQTGIAVYPSGQYYNPFSAFSPRPPSLAGEATSPDTNCRWPANWPKAAAWDSPT